MFNFAICTYNKHTITDPIQKGHRYGLLIVPQHHGSPIGAGSQHCGLCGVPFEAGDPAGEGAECPVDHAGGQGAHK